MYHIMVLEDHPIQRKRLTQILVKMNSKYHVLEADSLEYARQLVHKYPISLFFIDVELKDGSGLKFAEEVRCMSEYEFTWMVFISSFQEYIIQAFKTTHCYDYIVKPYNPADVEEITKKLLESPLTKKSERRFLSFDIQGIILKIDFNDIYFIEAVGKNCMIHTTHGEYEIKRMPLKKIVGMVKNSPLVQSHRAYIINTQWIKKIHKSVGGWDVFFKEYEKMALIGFTFRDYINELIME